MTGKWHFIELSIMNDLEIKDTATDHYLWNIHTSFVQYTIFTYIAGQQWLPPA